MTCFYNYTQKVNAETLNGKNYKYTNDGTEKDDGLEVWQKRALLFVNPFSGVKKSENHFEKCRKSLEANGFVLDVTITTTHKNHLSETLKNMPGDELKRFHIVLIIGGDGTVHEAINGFALRPDYKELELKFGSIIGGGGTAACG